MTATPDVITLGGAPGIGKSTLARRLAAARAVAAVVEVDVLRQMITDTDWTDTAQHVEALGFAADLALSLARSARRPVLVVDTFSKGKLPGFLCPLARAGLSTCSFCLVADDELLRARVLARPRHQFREADVSVALNRDALATSGGGAELVDVGPRTPAELADELVRRLAYAVAT